MLSLTTFFSTFKTISYKFVTLALLCFSLLHCSLLTDLAKKHVIQPEVNYKSISFGKISADGIELKPVFEVINKNGFSIPLDQLSYDLSFNQKSLLDGAITKLGSLPANGSKEVPISFMLNKEVLEAFKELLLNNEKLDYQVKGKAKMLGFSIPFEKKDTFYRPKISLGKINVGKSSFKELSASINLNIDNPNSFSLPLDSFGYKISTNNKTLSDGKIESTNLKNGVNEIKIPLSIKPNELFSNVFSLLSNPNLPLEFQLDSPLQSITKSETINLKDFISF